jgi:hypothetical protein
MLAAAAMYQHGQRLAEIVDRNGPDFVEAMALQAKSYLAAINALSLVDQRNAWIQYVLPPGESSKVGDIFGPVLRGAFTAFLFLGRVAKTSSQAVDSRAALSDC